MKKNILPETLLGVTQLICAFWAIFAQLTLMNNSTNGVSISMYFSLAVFAIGNAMYSFRIWRPARMSPNRTILTADEKEGRFGFVVYFLNFLGNIILFGFCYFVRVLHSNEILTRLDEVTFGLLAVVFFFAAYIRSLANRGGDPLANTYMLRAINIAAVFVPQTIAAVQIYKYGSQGISPTALTLGYITSGTRLVYYLFINHQVGDKLKKQQARSVIYGEIANLVSWTFITTTYYIHT